MNNRWTLLLVCAGLLAILTFAFVHPAQMVSPGPLSSGHSDLVPRCFSCHLPWRGATDERCVSCHKPDAIGIRTTTGTSIAPKTLKASFHRELLEPDCLACHGAHLGARSLLAGHNAFSHQLLRPAIRERCADCHAAPADRTHRELKAQCAQCHKQEHWKPASFDHALLDAQALTACEGCHKAPADKFHRQISKGCHQCHDAQQWEPARFDHDKHFKLDEAHDTECSSCHANEDYRRYTCYGCHEHTPKATRAKHQEEGVRFSDDCAKCHKSADEEGEGSGSGEGHEGDD